MRPPPHTIPATALCWNDSALAKRKLCVTLAHGHGSTFAQPGPGDLWLGDRNFSTYSILAGVGQRKSFFVVREHGNNAKLICCGPPEEKGQIETASLWAPRRLPWSDGRGNPARN